MTVDTYSSIRMQKEGERERESTNAALAVRVLRNPPEVLLALLLQMVPSF